MRPLPQNASEANCSLTLGAPVLQVGERKPQSGPFREAIKRAGYPSEDHVGGEWVHVGDDWATDCVGAKTMRMRTVLVRVPGKQAVGQAPVVSVNSCGLEIKATGQLRRLFSLAS